MQRVLVTVTVLSAVAVVVAIALTNDPMQSPTSAGGAACQPPVITSLHLTPVGTSGRRVDLRVAAADPDSDVGSISVSWGQGEPAKIFELVPSRRPVVTDSHTYPRNSRVAIVRVAADSGGEGCDVQRSPTVRQRIRLPL